MVPLLIFVGIASAFLAFASMFLEDELAIVLGVFIGVIGAVVAFVSAIQVAENHHRATFNQVCKQVGGKPFNGHDGSNICLTKDSDTIKIRVP